MTEAPLLQPTEVDIDAEQITTMQKELEDVAGMELPEGEDEDFWAWNLLADVSLSVTLKYINVYWKTLIYVVFSIS